MKWIKVAVFFVFGILIFLVVQEVMTPNWSEMENMNYAVRGIKELEENTVDVVFLGPSTTAWGISPMKLYEDTGICSYNLGTSIQNFPCSYFRLKDAFQTQSPSVVFCEANALFYGPESDKAWRYIADNMKLDKVKLEMAEAYETFVPEGSMWNMLVPILRYHDRWSQLSKRDFQVFKYEEYYSAGQFLIDMQGATNITTEAIEAEVKARASMNKGKITSFDAKTGLTSTEEIGSSIIKPEILDSSLDYLLKMKSLCDENGAELILIKLPSRLLPSLNPTEWTSEQYTKTKSTAEEYGIPFFDLTYDIDARIDFTTDTTDGHHLNFSGSEKAMKPLEEITQDYMTVKRQSNPAYEVALENYNKVREIAYLQMNIDYASYIDMLVQNKEKWDILVAASDDYVSGLNADDYANMEKLGLQLVDEGVFRSTYIAVIERGTVQYEAVSDQKITHTAFLDGKPLRMSSSGWFTTPGCEISIGGRNYAISGRGLNFVIYDRETGVVIDSVAFDTLQTTKPAMRNQGLKHGYLRAYEAKVCFGEDAA